MGTVETGIERQCRLYEQAISRKLGLPGWFVSAMDAAADGGPLPDAALMCRVLDPERPLENGSGFDGVMPDGTVLDFVEDLAFCTARRFYGWGIPSEESAAVAARVAAAAGGLAEIGAGTGYWSRVVAARAGVPVFPCDDRSRRSDDWDRHLWLPVERADALVHASRHPGLPLLVSWADPGPAAARVAQERRPGTRVLVCGPAHVTADEAFWAALDTWFDLEDEVPTGTASGSPDTLKVLVKRRDANPAPTGRFAAEQAPPIPRLSLSAPAKPKRTEG